MKMKNIYSVIVIALSVATFTGCNEDSTPTAGSRPVAQPGSAIRPEATQEQGTPPQTGEQPTPVVVADVVPVVQDEVVEQAETEGSNSTMQDEQPTTPVVTPEVKEEAGQQTQPSETVPQSTTTQEEKPQESIFPTWFTNLLKTTPKVTEPKYRLAEGQQYLQIDDLNGKRASRSDLDLTNGNVYLHCEHAQSAQQAPVDFLISRAEFEKMKAEGDLVESDDGDISMIVDDNVDGEKVSVQLGCKTLSRN